MTTEALMAKDSTHFAMTAKCFYRGVLALVSKSKGGRVLSSPTTQTRALPEPLVRIVPAYRKGS